MPFTELGLGPEVLHAIEDMGYTEPTPIQAQAIPYVLQGRDVLGCAQTGTGKTASFTLPMIEILASGRAKARMPRSLILEPTRELAAQVAENFETYGKYHKLNMALLIGGESMTDQSRKLDRGVDVLIATPGRMIDLFERGRIMLSDIKVFVIDEADRMLDMGFIPDIEKIAALLPPLRQTLLFSATMPPEIKRLADQFLSNPREISVSPPASPAEMVEQMVIHVDADDKKQALRNLLRAEDVKNALIFCNRKRDVALLQRALKHDGFNIGALHGDLAQSVRTETLEGFKRGDIALLACSDVAARGLDIAGLSHVFNFDVPHHAEDYVHRIGRTGRAGKSGRAFTLATPADAKSLAAITRLIKREIPSMPFDSQTPTPPVDAAPAPTRAPAPAVPAPLDPLPMRPAPRRGEGRVALLPETSQPETPAPHRGRRPERRDEHRRNDAPNRAPAAAVEPIEVSPAQAPVQPVSPPSLAPLTARTATPSPQRSASGNERDRGYHRRDDASDMDGTVGFGDHMPAFLLRPIRPSRLVPETTE